MNLKTQPRLDRVRDLFIIGCYTGLRFSDLKQLKDENLTDNRTRIRIRTEKTGELVIIPLHPFVKAILRKHNGIPPEALTNQKMNDYLKEIGEWAGIDETVVLHFTKGGQRVTETYKKYQLITTHTARRSFATNAYLQDVPTISIMKITGHRTEKSFMKYIKISQEDNANKLINHPFFK
jgi:integrase